MRIAVIEDNPADFALIQLAVRNHCDGAEVEWFSDGDQVLANLSKGDFQPPDLILLDLNLPHADGSQLLARIRASEQFEKTAVVILTSSNDPRDRQRAKEFGATDYIVKPPSLDQFLALGAKFKKIAGQASHG